MGIVSLVIYGFGFSKGIYVGPQFAEVFKDTNIILTGIHKLALQLLLWYPYISGIFILLTGLELFFALRGKLQDWIILLLFFSDDFLYLIVLVLPYFCH